jgi:hypothetical protein
MRLRLDGDAWIEIRVPVVACPELVEGVSTELVGAFSPRRRRRPFDKLRPGVTTVDHPADCGWSSFRWLLTPDFNYTLERARDSESDRHATETRPRVSPHISHFSERLHRFEFRINMRAQAKPPLFLRVHGRLRE